MNIIEIINAFSVFFALKTIRTIANHNCPEAPKKSIEIQGMNYSTKWFAKKKQQNSN